MNVYDEIKAERDRQDRKWGAVHDDRHDDLAWAAILSFYVGRFAMEELNGLNDGEQRETLVQVAALATAAIESRDRRHQPAGR